MKSPIAKKLLSWYASRRRSLPWREDPQPYAVWVAEIMAQQTRLESMLPYYERWMQRFPSIHALAASNEQDVLTAWEGLGYYSRARNLRQAAQIVIRDHGGRVPGSVEGLLSLPGIGVYTAGAIGSLAFGLDTPAVDSNAIRVLARVFNVDLPQGSSAAQKKFWELAAEHLPAGYASEFNQALMDLGAKVCAPRQPKCVVCPLRGECKAYALGIQEQLPVRAVGKKAPVRLYAAAVIQQRGRVLLLQRPARGLLGGMWEFPNAQVKTAGGAKSLIRTNIKKNLGIDLSLQKKLGDYEHAYSHFSVRLQVFQSLLVGKRPKIYTQREHQWSTIRELGSLPMGKLDRSIANTLRDTVS